jgi:hypothetical protein
MDRQKRIIVRRGGQVHEWQAYIAMDRRSGEHSSTVCHSTSNTQPLSPLRNPQVTPNPSALFETLTQANARLSFLIHMIAEESTVHHLWDSKSKENQVRCKSSCLKVMFLEAQISRSPALKLFSLLLDLTGVSVRPSVCVSVCHTFMRCPACVPNLAEKNGTLLLHRLDHRLPGLRLLHCPDARREWVSG